jgi:uncharacterized protein
LDDEPARGLRQGADAADQRELIPSEPAHRLPPAARTHWRLLTLIAAVPIAIAPIAAFGALGALAVPVIAAVVWLGPEIAWRRWRYEVRDEEIDLRHGLFRIRRTLVPIRRVQHVDTTSGPLQARFGLATVEFHTAAGGIEIPGLLRTEADVVRRRVAELARTRDDV